MPSPYNPYQYFPQQNNFQSPINMAAPQQMQNQNQIQSGGFISVPNEDIVTTYPVAPGNCLTFKIEGKPIVLEKSMGFSNLEAPKIERYRLVKESPTETNENTANCLRIDSAEEDTVKILSSKIEVLEHELEALKEKVYSNSQQKSSAKLNQNYTPRKPNK